MQTAYVVVRAFGPYAVGDVITDAEEVRRIASGECAGHVVRIERKEG